MKKMTKHVKEICKIGQGSACCRYLMVGNSGFECGKLTGLKTLLDDRVRFKTIVARGDNCEGTSRTTLNEKNN